MRLFVVFGALLLPWLNPIASGPSPSALPSLIAALCTGLAVLWVRPRVVLGLVALFFIALCAGLAGASGGFTQELLASWQALGMLWLCAAMGAQALATRPLARLVALAWLLAALISSVFALLQYAGWAHHFAPFISASAGGEAYGNLRQRNQMATLTCIGVAALLYLQNTNATKFAARQALSACAAALLLLANAVTASRTGLTQLLLLLCLAWLWRAGLPVALRRLLWLALPLYALGAWLLPWLKGVALGNAVLRIAHEDTGCGSRLVLWSNVWDLIAQKPWLGWGWRELAWAHYQTHFAPRFCQILDNAHNLPLHLAVELGLPVATAVCAVLLYALWRGKPWREANPLRQLAWSVLLCIGLHSLVEYPLWYGPFQMAAGLAVGLLWASRPGQRVRTEEKSLVMPYLYAFAAIILVASSAWAAYDYHRVSQMYLPLGQRSSAYREDTLRKIGSSLLFHNQLEFARLSVTPLTPNTAAQQRALAVQLLHYSPEPRVIEVLIESASLMGDVSAASAEARRYQEAFPNDYAQWRAKQLLAGMAAPAQAASAVPAQ